MQTAPHLSKPLELLLEKAVRCRLNGQTGQARLLVDLILQEAPGHPAGLLELGLLLAGEQPSEAIPLLQQALRNRPDDAEALFALGIACLQLCQFETAHCLLLRLAALQPGSWLVLRNLGKTLEALHRHQEALDCYQNAMHHAPGNSEPLLQAGRLLAGLGRFEEAIERFRQAAACAPQAHEPQLCLARALVELNRDEEGYHHYLQARSLAPDDVETMLHLAQLLIKTCNMDEAEQLLLQALRLAPHHAGLYNALGRVRNTQGRSCEALEAFQQARELEPELREYTSNLLFTLTYLPDADPYEVAEQHRQLVTALYPPEAVLAPLPCCKSPGPLRVGYLSPDFHTHSVASFFEPILQQHDRSRVLPFLYYGKGVEDETTRRLRTLAHQWRSSVGLSAEQVAQQIRADRIDILVELSGHTGLNRLDVCALRPAPVQVSWIGYPHSTGMRQIDYYISDRLCDSPGSSEPLFSEQIWRLPRIFCCYLPPLEFPPVRERDPDAALTFGCFNNFAKINEPLLELWIRILQQLPTACLMLKSSALAEGGSTSRHLRKRFEAAGIAPQRLLLQVVKKSAYEHLACYDQIDIALDSYPYHGTTTTCEALWMGVPVITLAGDCHLARVGVSFLNAVGLDELIARSREEYVELAVGLARNRQRLQELRTGLRMMLATSPLMDAAGVTRELEQAFFSMHDRACPQAAGTEGT